MIFNNPNLKALYLSGSFIGSLNFRNYSGVVSNLFFNNDLKPQYIGGSFIGSLNFRTGIIVDTEIVVPLLQTFFQIYGSDGGLKKTWYYNQDSTTPAMDLKIEITKNGSGAGSLKLAFLDFSINVEDEIRVLSGGSVIYKGFFENEVDVSEPVGKISPLSKRFKELTFTGSFTLESPQDILENVITTTASDTGISYNSSKVDFPDLLDPVTIDYQDIKIQDIINEMVDRGLNKYWGVDTDDEFFVKESNTTTPTQKIYLGENPRYGNIKVKIDYSKIRMTEAGVYAKRTKTISGENVSVTEYIGDVGTGGSYPVLSIRDKVRKIRGKLTAPDILPDDTDVLNWAYGRLTEKEAIVRETVTLSDYDYINYPLTIGETIQVEDQDKLTILNTNITNSVTNWTGVTLSTGRYDNNAVQIVSSGIYDYQYITQFYKQQKMGFFIKGEVDQQIRIAMSETPTPLTSEYTNIVINSTGVFSFYNISYTNSFRYIVIEVITGNPIIIDEINTLCYHRTQHIQEVSSVTLQYQPEKIKATVKLGDLIEEESFETFELNRKIRILEAIDKI